MSSNLTAKASLAHGAIPAKVGAASYRWIVLGTAITAQTMAAIVSQGVYILVPFWQLAFGLSQASAGLAVSFMNNRPVLVRVSASASASTMSSSLDSK
jgi:hypothetical protein